MPVWNWNLRDWLGVRTTGIRHRRRPRSGCARLECLESRALLSTNNAVLSGTAYIDADGDGNNDPNELVVRGIVVRLSGMSSANEAVNVQTTTNDEGEFTFIRVPVGLNYTLTAEPGDKLLGANVTITTVSVPSDTDSVTRNIAMGTIKPTLISLRQFLNTTTLADQPFATAGDGREPASNDIPTVTAPAAITVAQNASPTTIDLAGVFSDPNLDNSLIRMHTTAGDVNVELFDADTPQTVANFYNYITSGRYNDTIFHRLVNNFVLQGGGFKFDDAANSFPSVTTDPAIKNEFPAVVPAEGVNIAGTLAMAKQPTGPNTATNQFFFNLADNTDNLDNQNGGFTVFGRLKSASDMTVINNLVGPPTVISDRSSTNGAFDDLPLRNYSDAANPTAEFPNDASPSNFLRITGIDVVQRDEALTYSVVSNSNTALLTAAVVNNRLTLTYLPGQFGTADIVVRATDLGINGADKKSVDTTFSVLVNQLPTATVALSPSNPLTTSTLTATATKADGDGHPVTLNYVWKVGTTTVKTTTASSSLTDTLDLNTAGALTPAGAINIGDQVSVTVTPNDGLMNGTAVSSTRTVSTNVAPSATVDLSPDGPTTADTLTATATAADSNGQAVTLNYVWKVDGIEKKATTGSSSLTDTFVLSDFSVTAGQLVSVEVTPSDGTLSGSMVSDSTTVVPVT